MLLSFIAHLQLMVVNFLIFVGVKQLEGFFDFMFLILSQLSSLLSLVFVCRKLSSRKTNFSITPTYMTQSGFFFKLYCHRTLFLIKRYHTLLTAVTKNGTFRMSIKFR